MTRYATHHEISCEKPDCFTNNHKNNDNNNHNNNAIKSVSTTVRTCTLSEKAMCQFRKLTIGPTRTNVNPSWHIPLQSTASSTSEAPTICTTRLAELAIGLAVSWVLWVLVLEDAILLRAASRVLGNTCNSSSLGRK